MNAPTGHENVNTGAMHRNVILLVALTLTLLPLAANAQEGRHGGPGSPQRVQMTDQGVEAFRGPRGYHRIERPRGAEMRPSVLDSHAYNHNYRAPHAFRIGPYHPPGRWHYRRWHYGQFLPPVYWGRPYLLPDFWLFGLDIPPLGYAWVRYGDDAILIELTDGRIVQIVYGIFF
jgi:Ni/Co efflux regulator RcnB